MVPDGKRLQHHRQFKLQPTAPPHPDERGVALPTRHLHHLARREDEPVILAGVVRVARLKVQRAIRHSSNRGDVDTVRLVNVVLKASDTGTVMMGIEQL